MEILKRDRNQLPTKVRLTVSFDVDVEVGVEVVTPQRANDNSRVTIIPSHELLARMDMSHQPGDLDRAVGSILRAMELEMSARASYLVDPSRKMTLTDEEPPF